MANTNEKSIEVMLWESANKLRGSVDAAEYKHVVLGLVFLKFISETPKCLLFERNRILAQALPVYGRSKG